MTSPGGTTRSRQRAMLRTAMGPVIGAALEDPAVIEVMANPDGTLWLDRHGEGRIDTGECIEPTEAEGEEEREGHGRQVIPGLEEGAEGTSKQRYGVRDYVPAVPAQDAAHPDTGPGEHEHRSHECPADPFTQAPSHDRVDAPERQ